MPPASPGGAFSDAQRAGAEAAVRAHHRAHDVAQHPPHLRHGSVNSAPRAQRPGVRRRELRRLRRRAPPTDGPLADDGVGDRAQSPRARKALNGSGCHAVALEEEASDLRRSSARPSCRWHKSDRASRSPGFLSHRTIEPVPLFVHDGSETLLEQGDRAPVRMRWPSGVCLRELLELNGES